MNYIIVNKFECTEDIESAFDSNFQPIHLNSVQIASKINRSSFEHFKIYTISELELEIALMQDENGDETDHLAENHNEREFYYFMVPTQEISKNILVESLECNNIGELNLDDKLVEQYESTLPLYFNSDDNLKYYIVPFLHNFPNSLDTKDGYDQNDFNTEIGKAKWIKEIKGVNDFSFALSSESIMANLNIGDIIGNISYTATNLPITISISALNNETSQMLANAFTFEPETNTIKVKNDEIANYPDVIKIGFVYTDSKGNSSYKSYDNISINHDTFTNTKAASTDGTTQYLDAIASAILDQPEYTVFIRRYIPAARGDYHTLFSWYDTVYRAFTFVRSTGQIKNEYKDADDIYVSFSSSAEVIVEDNYNDIFIVIKSEGFKCIVNGVVVASIETPTIMTTGKSPILNISARKKVDSSDLFSNGKVDAFAFYDKGLTLAETELIRADLNLENHDTVANLKIWPDFESYIDGTVIVDKMGNLNLNLINGAAIVGN